MEYYILIKERSTKMAVGTQVVSSSHHNSSLYEYTLPMHEAELVQHSLPNTASVTCNAFRDCDVDPRLSVNLEHP